MGILSTVFSGKGGGDASEKADFCIVVTGERTNTIQEMHIVLAHTFCECIGSEIFGLGVQQG